MSTFHQDLETGNEFESRLCVMIQKRYPTATRIPSEFSDYDIYIAETNKKIECKYDKKAKETGNIFIELKSNDNQSGILKSKADYYYIDTGLKLYCIPLIKLFECVIFENIKPTKHLVNQGEYEMEMTGCIIPIDIFQKYCIQIQPTLMKLN